MIFLYLTPMELGNSQLPIISSTITSFRKKEKKRKQVQAEIFSSYTGLNSTHLRRRKERANSWETFVDLPENETKHLEMVDDDNKDSNTKRMEKDFPITER